MYECFFVLRTLPRRFVRSMIHFADRFKRACIGGKKIMCTQSGEKSSVSSVPIFYFFNLIYFPVCAKTVLCTRSSSYICVLITARHLLLLVVVVVVKACQSV